MKIISYLNRIIEYSFYSLFLLVPLIFSSSPSELFEFPKMWLTFGITILIGTSWITKMILQKEIMIQRTPLDIPILLFLASQVISTIFSLDSHVSLWGFYSRFNGGLLSIISYIFLYYAVVSNLTIKHVFNLLKISLFAGFLVALWGLPSHFGVDPTCYIFRGSFDTSCWTEAFKPTIRIFSTLGQPAWMAAYMSILIPIAATFALTSVQEQKLRELIKNKRFIGFLVLSLMFYASLTYTDTRGGFMGFWVANLAYWAFICVKGLTDKFSFGIHFIIKTPFIKKVLFHKKPLQYFFIFNILFLVFNFLQGAPLSQLSKFTLPELSKTAFPADKLPVRPEVAAGALGGTDSGKIRLLVWRGAVDAWLDHPVIGTGVETFAYAYYKYRPIEHNLTSEWDFLYNKAHNEYLNYLTTTGIFGLGSYLAIIATFLFVSVKKLKIQNSKFKTTIQKSKLESLENSLEIGNWKLEIALISAYISILVSNFFGFSVVIINLYFFLIPAFVFILGNFLDAKKSIVFPNKELRIKSPSNSAGRQKSDHEIHISKRQWVLIACLLLTSYFLLRSLTSYWRADISYAAGSNLHKGNAYQEAYSYLVEAVLDKDNEPIYKDELSINMGTIASALYLQNDASSAAELKDQAIALNDDVVRNHPNNIVFWKNRVRLFYTLAQGDEKNQKTYYQKALDSISKAQALAPNDAKVSYNLGVLLGQTGDIGKGIQVLENTVRLKNNYRDAYFALGLYYHELAIDQNGNVVNPVLQEKATQTYEYILKNIDPEDTQVKEALEEWK